MPFYEERGKIALSIFTFYFLPFNYRPRYWDSNDDDSQED